MAKVQGAEASLAQNAPHLITTKGRRWSRGGGKRSGPGREPRHGIRHKVRGLLGSRRVLPGVTNRFQRNVSSLDGHISPYFSSHLWTDFVDKALLSHDDIVSRERCHGTRIDFVAIKRRQRGV